MTKKKGTIYTQIDLGEKVYEKAAAIKADQFVNSKYKEIYGGRQSEEPTLMTNVLVAVPTKRAVEFQKEYYYYLIDHQLNGIDGWKKRTERDMI